jgi:hypothetical protein
MNSCGSANAVSQSPIDWSITPNVIKIPSNSMTTMLNVTAKLKNSFAIKNAPLKKSLSEEEKTSEATHTLQRSNTMDVNKKYKTEKYTHLLIGKIKDTQILFSFIVEASIVEPSETQPIFC